MVCCLSWLFGAASRGRVFFLVTKGQEPVAVFPLKRQCEGRFGIKLRRWLLPRSSEEIVLCDIVAVDKDVLLPAFHALQNKLNSTKGLQYDAIF